MGGTYQFPGATFTIGDELPLCEMLGEQLHESCGATPAPWKVYGEWAWVDEQGKHHTYSARKFASKYTLRQWIRERLALGVLVRVKRVRPIITDAWAIEKLTQNLVVELAEWPGPDWRGEP